MKARIINIGFKLLEILAGLGVAYGFKHIWENAPEGLEWLAGGVVTLILLGVEQAIRGNENYQEQKASVAALDGKLVAMQDGQSKLQDALKAMSTGHAKMSAELTLLQVAASYAGRDLDPADTANAWRDLTWCAQESYLATNYINPKIFYGGNDAKDVVNFQLAKLRCNSSGFSIQKVLIWKDEQERKSPEVKDIIRLHRSNHGKRMDLYEILHVVFESDAELQEELKKVEQEIDFAVFDRKVALVWHLNKDTREVDGGTVVLSDEKVRKFERFFNRLLAHAATIK
jgi:hypothetical protein